MARLTDIPLLARNSADSLAIRFSFRQIGERNAGRGLSAKRSLRAALSKRISPTA
jgi:hypothetical protein